MAPRPTAARASGPTDWPALNAAIAAIPGYADLHSRPVWHVGSIGGHWGTTIMDARPPQIYVSRAVPSGVLFSLVLHEYAHFVQMQDYGWDFDAMSSSVAAGFGLSESAGAEYAADCMAIVLGATWTNYTSCTSSRWRALARELLAGRRL